MDPTSFKMFMASPIISAAEPAIGDSYEGGFFAGYISQNADGVATHRLIVSPKSSGESTQVLQNPTSTVSTTVYDGATNTANFITAGNSPACSFVTGLSIGGYSDWYLAALKEMQIAYYNLKPTQTSNFTSRGINDYQVPPRTVNWTSSDPAKTSVSLFSGSEAFHTAYHWCSSQAGANNFTRIRFSDGRSNGAGRTLSLTVRAFRKESV